MPPNHQWLFLRGLGRESGHWGRFASEFEQQVAGAKVIALDLPGTGRRLSEKSPRSISAIVEAVRSDWKKTAHPEIPSYFLGISLGGMVGAEWISSFPDDFAGAVLINTSSGSSTPLRRLKPSALGRLAKAAAQKDSRVREELILHLVSNHSQKPDEVVRHWTQIHHQRPISPQNVLLQLWAAFQWKASRTAPRVPVLLLCGAKDRLTSPECSATLQSLWNCRLETHPTGGHELAEDAPAWICQKINDWRSESR